ncbi:MAG: metallophosphoesterase family protein [Anaeromyxobacteraceae bacterium]
MRLALLSDLHANLEALEACLAHAQAAGAEQWAFLGDLVGYGPDPVAVIDRVAGFARRGAAVVLGNHDEAALEGDTEFMNGPAAEAVRWTRQQLGEREREFLRGLPLSVSWGDVLLVHASAEAPKEWIYVNDTYRAQRCFERSTARFVFVGHVHEQALYFEGPHGRPVPFSPKPGVPIPTPIHRRWLAVVGSAGQPRDGNTAAAYAMADLAKHTLTFHRVPYDWRTVARKMRDAGLPELLAQRLERGG